MVLDSHHRARATHRWAVCCMRCPEVTRNDGAYCCCMPPKCALLCRLLSPCNVPIRACHPALAPTAQAPYTPASGTPCG